MLQNNFPLLGVDLCGTIKLMFGIIYVITNTANGKQYVGQTTLGLDVRWWYHVYSAGRGLKYALYRSIRKYGVEAFKIEQIDVAETLEELNEKEAYHILRLKTFAPNGYNLTTGGEGFLRSEETRKKMSEYQQFKPSVSEETRRKISEARKGYEASAETRQKLSQAALGRTHSEETRRKMSESGMGHVVTGETRQKMSKSQWNRCKTHCKHGHLFDSTNTYLTKDGRRVCRTCQYLNAGCKLPERLLPYVK
jgi:group I intron endonuclease